jgi:excisionase family DNA binding protein
MADHLVSGAICAEKSSEVWFTTKQAAEYLQVSEIFLSTDRCTRRYGIPFYRLGKRIRYNRRDLDAMLGSGKVE